MKKTFMLTSLITLTACSGSFKSSIPEGAVDQASASNVPVLPVLAPAGVNPNCHIQLQATNTPIKVIFVVDASGSNAAYENSAGVLIYGSDYDKNLRGNSINNFYKDYGDNVMFRWTFITFKGPGATVLLTHGDKVSMRSAIDAFFVLRDLAETPYMAALNAARDAIANDSNPGAEDKYVVIFMSDGLPNPFVSDAVLDAKIDEIVALKPGAVTVNGIYYGIVDPLAAGRIQAMATRGGGKFLDLGGMGPNTFQVASSIRVPNTACQ